MIGTAGASEDGRGKQLGAVSSNQDGLLRDGAAALFNVRTGEGHFPIDCVQHTSHSNEEGERERE